MSGRPDWLEDLTGALRAVRGHELSRLLPPEDGSGRPSAVLLALCEWHGRPAVVLLQRSSALRSHAGQVAFPGGSTDPGDADAVATALREAQEEAGIDPADVEVLAVLPALFIPVSNFVVTPVVGWWRAPGAVRPDGSEMLRAAVVPLAELADPAHRYSVRAPSGWRGPAFDVAGLTVWGFTAGLLDALLTLGGWTRPWDPDARVEPAPVPGRDPVDDELVD